MIYSVLTYKYGVLAGKELCILQYIYAMKFNPDMSFPFVLYIVVMISMKLLCGTKVQIKCFTCKAKASQDLGG